MKSGKNSQWTIVTSYKGVSPDFFRHSGFRSYYFVSNTLILAFVLGLELIVVVRWSTRLPMLTVGWLAYAAISMLVLWARAWKDHARIRELFRSGQIDKVEPGSPMDRVLRAAAWLGVWGLFFAFLGIGAVTVALGGVLLAR